METLSTEKSFGGTQGVYRHTSETTGCDMTFALFLPPQAQQGPVPVLWYLSGLTCTHANVMEKGEYRRVAAELGIAIVCPDTSPRGDGIPDDEDWTIGHGAGLYLNATEAPWSTHYQMFSYVSEELPAVIAAHFPLRMDRQGIFGHSMGGHGALTIALRHSDRFRSCSAFAPITNPSEAELPAATFARYLGENKDAWRAYDSVALIEDGHGFPEVLVDQGDADEFLEMLQPKRLESACKGGLTNLTLRMQPGYGHSYYFVSTFMEDHLRWHAARLCDDL